MVADEQLYGVWIQLDSPTMDSRAMRNMDTTLVPTYVDYNPREEAILYNAVDVCGDPKLQLLQSESCRDGRGHGEAEHAASRGKTRARKKRDRLLNEGNLSLGKVS